MPVKRRPIGIANAGEFHSLVADLAEELKNPREFGQPLVDEEAFARTGLLGVTVIWDKWASVPELKRPEVILEAYEQARGIEEKNEIAFAIGMTIEEAIDGGKLPYVILPHLRSTDSVKPDEVRSVMVELGGKTRSGDFPAELRFATIADAEACKKRLIQRFPGTEDVWGIVTEAKSPEWAY